MFVRIARFEGGSPEGVAAQVAAIKETLTSSQEMPPGLDKVKRFLVLSGGEGRFASITFCDTKEDLAAADAALNAMNPDSGGGSRASVDLYETAIDETMG